MPDAPARDPIEESDAAALYQRALERARAHDYVRAEQYFVAARLQGHPEGEIMPPLIRVLIAASRLRAALGYAEPYLRRHPDEHELRYVVASLYLALSQVRDAQDALERVIRAVPDHAPSHYLSAVIWRDRIDDPNHTRRAFQNYLALQPDGIHADEARSWLRAHQPIESQPEVLP